MIITSFIVFMGIFLGIGLWATSLHKNTTEDYLLAGRNVNPWLAGLSACASEKSGFTFIGYVGMVYMVGLSGVWLFLGMYTAYFFFLPKMAAKTKHLSDTHNFETYTDLLDDFRKNKSFTKLVPIAGIITIVFLGLYAAAQLTAGSKALNVLFGWPEATGALIGAVILLFYSYSGGIRASIWTDAAQMAAMVLSMGVLLVGSIIAAGGFGDFWTNLQNIEPGFTSFIPDAFMPVFLLWLGWFFGGIGISGQPQIMIRFMAVNTASNAKKAHYVFLGSNMIFVFLTTLTAMAARLLLDHSGDPELTLPLLAMGHLPEAMVGLMLAGLFASTMSTADSQVLSCSAALSQNIIPKWKGQYDKAKLSTFLVITLVTLVALYGPNSVFTLVVAAWGGLAAAFGPLAILRFLGKHPSERLSLLIMMIGLLTALMWRFGGLSSQLFEAAPGIAAGFIIYIMAYIYKRIRGEKL